MICLNRPNLFEFILEHPSCSPATTDSLSVRIQPREKLTKGSCASILDFLFQAMDFGFDLA